LKWSQKRDSKYYATSDAGYMMCWDDAKPTLYRCSYRKEWIGKAYDVNEAKAICDKHLAAR